MRNNATTTLSAGPCRFCNLLNEHDASTSSFDAPWLLSDDFAAIASVGALVPGWSLICPRKHAENMTASFRSDAFWSFAAKAEALIRRRYGEVRIFEHGATFHGSLTGCGVNHAHLHMVPLEFNLEIEALRFDSALVWHQCSISDIEEVAKGREYLYVADSYLGLNTRGLLCVLETEKSQFFRRVVATRLGMADLFNYRQYQMHEIASRTAGQLKEDAGVSLQD